MKELRFILIALTCIGLAIGLWLLIQGWSVGRGEEKGGWTSYPVTDQERARLLLEMKDAGEQVVRKHCSTCHSIGDNVDGAPLDRVMAHGPWADDTALLRRFIKDPAATIPTHPYLVGLRKMYGQTMPAFKDSLTDEEITSIIDYLRISDDWYKTKIQ
jgi:mono/diheme cytochrome c family protein